MVNIVIFFCCILACLYKAYFRLFAWARDSMKQNLYTHSLSSTKLLRHLYILYDIIFIYALPLPGTTKNHNISLVTSCTSITI